MEDNNSTTDAVTTDTTTNNIADTDAEAAAETPPPPSSAAATTTATTTTTPTTTEDACVDVNTNGVITTEDADESSCPNSNWSKEKLMGKSAVAASAIDGSLKSTGAAGSTTTTTAPAPPASPSGMKRLSLSKRQSSKKMPKPAAGVPKGGEQEGLDPALWGRPGHLSDSDADTYLKFKEVIDARGGDFKDTVYSFGEEEGEVFALCRWCRARKFDLEAILRMVEEATACRAEAKSVQFYPDPKSALGCDPAVYAAQYPQVYSGYAKNGAPVYFSKMGLLNIEAIECITTVSSIVKYHWYVQMHDFGTRLRAHKEKNPDFQKFECVCVMDCAQLTMAQLGSRAMAIIKEQSAIDSLCFPETLNKMYIVNSPLFFSATWSIIKGWLDPRTASKIEVISNRKTWEKALLEYVDAEELPSDYGGTGPNTQDTMETDTFTGKLKRVHSEVLYVRGHGHITYDIIPDEELSVSIYTRSTAGAKWTISDAKKKHGGAVWVGDVETKHTGDDLELPPTHVQLTKANIKGPASIKVKAQSHGSRWSSEKFLVVISVFHP